MGRYDPIAVGTVTDLLIDGTAHSSLFFSLEGPSGDSHATLKRTLSGHDSDYIRTSKLVRGDQVFNWRTWTGVSSEEIYDVECALGAQIPAGCILENIRVRGIPRFSELPPTSRLVFPEHPEYPHTRQAILAVWEKNGPCRTVGSRIGDLHNDHALIPRFVEVAQDKRGVTGFVLAPGFIEVGDVVHVHAPT